MIPNEWKEIYLGDVITHKKGFAFNSSSYRDKGIRIVRISDTTRNSVHAENPVYLAQEDAFGLDQYILFKDDIILSTVGSRPHLLDSMVGKAVKVPMDADGSLLNQNLVKVVPKASKITNEYLFEILKNNRFIFFISTLVRGNANQVSITLADLFQYQFFLPPLPEQQKIAKILSTWDNAISTTEQLLANSQQQKKALMQQLLTGQRRLLDDGVRLSGEWSSLNLGQILSKVSNGVTYDSNNVEGLPVTRIETISTGKINFNKVGFAPDEENTKRFKLHQGDILYSHINSLEHIGRVAYFNDARPLYHGMNLLLLRTGEKHDSLYIYYLLGSELGKKYAKSYAKSAVNQASISTTDVKAFRFLIPKLPEQQKIAAVLSAADQDISTLQQQLATLKQEKKALMQQLLTGKVRVNTENPA